MCIYVVSKWVLDVLVWTLSIVTASDNIESLFLPTLKSHTLKEKHMLSRVSQCWGHSVLEIIFSL
jgi:hypothetical protein